MLRYRSVAALPHSELRRRGGGLEELIECFSDSWVPLVHHFDVTRGVGVDAITKIGGREVRVLVDEPDGRIRGVLGFEPGWDGCIERFYGSVRGWQRDNLCHLYGEERQIVVMPSGRC